MGGVVRIVIVAVACASGIKYRQGLTNYVLLIMVMTQLHHVCFFSASSIEPNANANAARERERERGLVRGMRAADINRVLGGHLFFFFFCVCQSILVYMSVCAWVYVRVHMSVERERLRMPCADGEYVSRCLPPPPHVNPNQPLPSIPPSQNQDSL